MELPPNMYNVIIGLSILVGAVQCFLGYRLFKIILGLTGFLLGGVLGGAVGYTIWPQEVAALAAGLVGGIIGAAVLVGLYFIGVFLIGALLGGVLGQVFFAVAEANPQPVVILIIAVIVGVIALIFQKLMIIVSTGFGGAWIVVVGITYFTTGAIDLTNLERMYRSGGSLTYAMLLCWTALGIIGVVVQYKSAPTKEQETRLSASPDGENHTALPPAAKR